MSQRGTNQAEGRRAINILKGYTIFKSTIYSRVVFIITVSSVILFLSFGIIFRSVYEQNLNNVIRQNGTT
jgi:two-component system NtrC family sensor kinase